MIFLSMLPNKIFLFFGSVEVNIKLQWVHLTLLFVLDVTCLISHQLLELDLTGDNTKNTKKE